MFCQPPHDQFLTTAVVAPPACVQGMCASALRELSKINANKMRRLERKRQEKRAADKEADLRVDAALSRKSATEAEVKAAEWEHAQGAAERQLITRLRKGLNTIK